ncbi:MAG: tetratricopeptide repeat protein, partial [bacterium]
MKINPRHLRLSRPVPDSPARRRHANNYYVMGKGASDAGCWQEAREYLDKALEYYAELQPALRELAFVYMSQNDYPKAFKYIKLALDADPKDAAAHFLHGNIALNTGDANGALEAYRHARELGELTLELLNNIGLAHLMHNDGVAAGVVFRELTAEFPTSANGWDGLGCAQRIAGDFPGAIASFYRALEIEPALNEAREHLGRTYIEAGEPRNAILILTEAIRH